MPTSNAVAKGRGTEVLAGSEASAALSNDSRDGVEDALSLSLG